MSSSEIMASWLRRVAALHWAQRECVVAIGRQFKCFLQTADGFKRLIELVPSVANGISFCQGSVTEWGADVVEAIHYFGSRDKIHHVHYRNPKGTYPNYVETWIDEGDLDMLATMKTFRDVNYRFTLCSGHVPSMTDDLAFA